MSARDRVLGEFETTDTYKTGRWDDAAMADEILRLRGEVEALPAWRERAEEGVRFYAADGSFETFPPSVVKGKRIDAAKSIVRLNAIISEQADQIRKGVGESREELAALRKDVNAKYWEGIRKTNGEMVEQLAEARKARGIAEIRLAQAIKDTNSNAAMIDAERKRALLPHPDDHAEGECFSCDMAREVSASGEAEAALIALRAEVRAVAGWIVTQTCDPTSPYFRKDDLRERADRLINLAGEGTEDSKGEKG